ncbi:hypothetical protein [Neptunomonas sp.]|uniref:hypothetical protein n=1 Tax=Neptunomonas sp. TaxID=1971898 RepID=UPI003565E9E5
MTKWILLSGIIFLSACQSATIPVVVKLPLPPEVTYPAIQVDALQCLSDETYSDLVRRDRMKTERIQTLTDIIRTTHE